MDVEDKLKSIIIETFKKNKKEGFNEKVGKKYFYYAPSWKNYPYQWLWDSCFHAIINLYINPKDSLSEIKTLISTQFEDGMIPHMAYWIKIPIKDFLNRNLLKKYRDSYRSRFTQPPIIAYTLKRISEKMGKDLIQNLVPHIEKYFDYLESRDFFNEGLPNIIHSWESGLDNLPVYDAVYGTKNPPKLAMKMTRLVSKYSKMEWNFKEIAKSNLFLVRDLLFVSVYAEGLEILYKLTGDKKWLEKYRKTLNAIFELWDDKRKIFLTKYSHNKMIDVKTITIFMPLLLDIPKDITEDLINEHLLNKKEFWLTYPIPTVSADEKSFNPHSRIAYWRGPTWISTNWLVVRGLLKHGYKDLAKEITDKSIELVIKNGMREFYDPITGKAHGAVDFGWSGLVLDMLHLTV